MLGGHITELFDRWDHTLRSGQEADYTVVFVAACLGVAFVGIKNLVFAFTRFSFDAGLQISMQRWRKRRSGTVLTPATGPSPPLLILPIRI